MTSTEQQILALLERKPETFTLTYRWLIEAVELLLRHQLEMREREAIEKLNKDDLCKEITKEVMAVIDGYMADKIIVRNAGILR